MKQNKTFQEKLTPEGHILNYEQRENGLYLAEIRDENNVVESACIRETLNEIWEWLDEQGF